MEIRGQFLNNPDERLFALQEGEVTYCCSDALCGHTPNSFQENILAPRAGVLLEEVWREEGSRWLGSTIYYRIVVSDPGAAMYLVVRYQEDFSPFPACCGVVYELPGEVAAALNGACEGNGPRA